MSTLKLRGNGIAEALAKLKASSGKTWPDLLRSNTRLVAVSLTTQTQPFGTGKDAQESGINATKRDIGKVYATPTKIYGELLRTSEQQARGFYAALLNGKLERARKILQASSTQDRDAPIGTWDGGALHKSSRNSIGRVSRRRAGMILSTDKEFNIYLQKKMKLVGFAKAGWSVCAKQLGGTRGIPGWVSRQKSDGQVIEKYPANNPSVRIINNVRYIDRCISQGQIQEALRIQAEKMIRYADRQIASQMRACGFR